MITYPIIYPDQDSHPLVAGLARGDTYRQASQRLGSSHTTVTRRARDLIERTGTRSPAGLVAYGYEAGWYDQLTAEPRPDHRPLTPRQHEVLRDMARGWSNPEIAAATYHSVEGIRSRAKGLYAALGARTRAHAVALGYQHGYLTVDHARRRQLEDLARGGRP